eukprot:Lithocolla_globosa_v1_NODE_768_length_3315_cov_5.115644.p1 type:complete len:429 gc:universal NODE_768_length_3315_cov_5.115644:2568-1282(-)
MTVEDSLTTLSTIFDSNSLSILHQNCQSLQKHYDDFTHFILSLPVRFTMYAVSELWCNKLDDFSHLDTLDGYTLIPKKRTRKGGGGVAFYLQNDINYDILDIEIEGVDSLWLEIDTKTGKEIFAVIYRNEDTTISNFCVEFERILSGFETAKKKVTISGDFNIDLQKLDYTSDYIQTTMFNQFRNLIIYETHTAQTTNTKSCIDHILINKLTAVNAGIIQNDICRHNATFVSFDNNSCRQKEKVNVYTDMSKYSRQEFHTLLKENLTKWSNRHQNLNPDNLDVAYVDFTNVLSETFGQFVTTKVDKLTNKIKQPWISIALLKCIRKQHTLYSKSKKNPKLQDKHKKYKKMLTSILQQAKKSYLQEKLDEIKTKPDSAWDAIKQLMGRGKRKVQKKPDITAHQFCKFFTHVGPNLAAKIPIQQKILFLP